MKNNEFINLSIYEFTDYKKYINTRIKESPHRGHGMRLKLAGVLNCYSGYISQILNGNAHLSIEQADLANRFFGHTNEESDFFICLVQLERAGTVSLKKYFKNKIDQMMERQLNLKNRLKIKQHLTIEDQAVYYSAWYFAVIHIMVTVPQYQNREAMARTLGLPLKKVSEVLRFLASVGLVVEENGRYRIGTERIHLPADSPLVSKHHANWRQKAMQSLDRDPDSDLHYSSVVSLSARDIVKIKSMLVKSIEEIKSVVKESKEETVQCFSLDFFGVA
ncbi:MAG: hypothetical protein A2583_05565 [Bdellovibrionales bacterium RIFOXYD1_FULL_53_11]|nr:MAG: hypothetical protein A2583_05565 [Bdellovibrionales bacterium RIFOXYD1_FULL_53_11]